jgi:hypothetical protein
MKDVADTQKTRGKGTGELMLSTGIEFLSMRTFLSWAQFRMH